MSRGWMNEDLGPLKFENSHKFKFPIIGCQPTILRTAASLLSDTVLCALCFAHFAGFNTNLLPPGRQTKCHCDIFPPLAEKSH